MYNASFIIIFTCLPLLSITVYLAITFPLILCIPKPSTYPRKDILYSGWYLLYQCQDIRKSIASTCICTYVYVYVFLVSRGDILVGELYKYQGIIKYISRGRKIAVND